MNSARHTYLIGFSGSGKSTVGPLLAKQLGRPFYDTDRLIERRERLTIPELFRRRGEAYFRTIERRVIADVSTRRRRSVIGLGGGAFASATNRKLVRASGLVVYLSCTRRVLMRRLRMLADRPLLHLPSETGKRPRHGLKDRVDRLLNRRLVYYRTADLTCSTTARKPQQVVDVLLRKLERLHEDH